MLSRQGNLHWTHQIDASECNAVVNGNYGIATEVRDNFGLGKKGRNKDYFSPPPPKTQKCRKRLIYSKTFCSREFGPEKHVSMSPMSSYPVWVDEATTVQQLIPPKSQHNDNYSREFCQ